MDATESFQLQNLYQVLCFGLVPISCVCTDAELQVNACFPSTPFLKWIMVLDYTIRIMMYSC